MKQIIKRREFIKATSAAGMFRLGTASAAPKVAKDNTPPEGFRALFNGRDLDGWTEGGKLPVNWTVKDGVLVFTGEWNHFEITVAKGVITVLTNGAKTVEGFKKDWGSRSSGSIGFQNHGTPLWFKNVYIKKLED